MSAVSHLVIISDSEALAILIAASFVGMIFAAYKTIFYAYRWYRPKRVIDDESEDD